MRRTARHRVDTRLGEDALSAARSAVDALRDARWGARRDPSAGRASSRSARRAALAAGAVAVSVALSLVAIPQPSALAAPDASPSPSSPSPSSRSAAPTVAPQPAPVRYTVPAAVARIAPARDAYGITVLPPPDPPDRVTWPIPATTTVSSPFGPRVAPCATCSAMHRGADLVPGEGTPVAAIADGVVVDSGTDPAAELGVFAVVRVTVRGEVVDSLYAHMLSGSMTLRPGDRVEGGQRIGSVGNTGVSTGAHLHFGILRGGEPVDPLAWVAARAAG